MLVPEIKTFNRSESHALFLAIVLQLAAQETALLALFYLVVVALEHVEVPTIGCDEGSGVAAFVVERRHLNPPLVQDVELLAVPQHHVLAVATTNHIDVPVAKIVMSSKGCPRHANIRHPFDPVGRQTVDKGISDWHTVISFHVLARNDQYLSVWDVQAPAELQ